MELDDFNDATWDQAQQEELRRFEEEQLSRDPAYHEWLNSTRGS